jgi:hypothetical protein
VSGCVVVYVLLGERPEDDRLQRCTRWPCYEHEAQLGWVRADPDRLAAYRAQERRYDADDRVGPAGEQAALL